MDAAQMCSRVAMLCKEVFESGGPEAWPQLKALASNLMQAAHHTAESSYEVGRYAMTGFGSTLLPLLETTKKRTSGEEARSRKARRAKLAVAVKGCMALMKSNERVSTLGEKCLGCSNDLANRVSEMMDAISGVVILKAVSCTALRNTMDVLCTLAGLAGDAADLTVAAAMSIGEAKQHARRLAEALEALGAGRGEREEADEAEEDTKEDDDEETTPAEDRWARRALLQKLIGSVAALQGELRGIALKNPALLPAVSAEQKSLLFNVLAEIFVHAKEGASRAWYSSASEQDKRDGEDTEPGGGGFEAMLETEFGFAFAAAEWERLPMPSLEARLLRLSVLVDSETARGMLRALFEHAMHLAEGDSVLSLGKRFQAAEKALFANLTPPSRSTG